MCTIFSPKIHPTKPYSSHFSYFQQTNTNKKFQITCLCLYFLLISHHHQVDVVSCVSPLFSTYSLALLNSLSFSVLFTSISMKRSIFFRLHEKIWIDIGIRFIFSPGGHYTCTVHDMPHSLVQ